MSLFASFPDLSKIATNIVPPSVTNAISNITTGNTNIEKDYLKYTNMAIKQSPILTKGATTEMECMNFCDQDCTGFVLDKKNKLCNIYKSQNTQLKPSENVDSYIKKPIEKFETDVDFSSDISGWNNAFLLFVIVALIVVLFGHKINKKLANLSSITSETSM